MSRENYVSVPKDLSKIRNKIIMGLTKRQIIGMTAAAAVGVPVLFLMMHLTGDQTAAMFGLFATGAPILFIVNKERNGMPSEEWLKNWLYFKAVSQKKRPYSKPCLKPGDVRARKAAIAAAARREKAEEKRHRERSGAYYAISKGKKENIITVLKAALERLIGKIGRKEVPETTAQDTLKYKEIFKNGICRISKNMFSKTICFEDINYQLVRKEEQQKIFTDYSGFLNSFEEAVRIQMTFTNEIAASSKMPVNIEMQPDGLDHIRQEYQEMLAMQVEKGNNGLIRRKYITFTVEARSIYEARQRLHRIESDAISILKSMSVKAFPISGKEKLRILHSVLNDKGSKLRHSWERQQRLALSTQDFISPKLMSFGDKRFCKSGKKYIQTQYLAISASELSDRVLADFLDIEAELVVNIHIQPLEQQKAIKGLKSKTSNVDRMVIEEQKKALRSGYDIDIMPTDLAMYAEETKEVLNQLQNEDEKLFDVTILVTNIASSKPRLDSDAMQARSVALKNNCELVPYDYHQEGCLLSMLPLGINEAYPRRELTTRALAVFIPFTTQEIFMGGKSLYYGLNALSSNMIMADRKKLKNPNGLILGVPGSGKTFAGKREMTNVYLITDDNIMIYDPEGEYAPLVDLLGGQVVDISQNSKQFINPLDIDLSYTEEGNPVIIKTDFVISMMELICGGKQGLSAVEVSLIDRCTRKIYEPLMEKENPAPEDVPILEDLYNSLRDIEGSDEARWMADALEIYVRGSLRMFNNRTNIDITSRLICYNTKRLTKSVKKLAMLIIQDQVWNAVTTGRAKKKYTWFYIDEFHLLLKDRQTAEYSVEMWKRFRKWWGIPTGITQNVEDLLFSKEVESIFKNSDFVYLLDQASGDREVLAEKLDISKQQISHVENSDPGCGLLKYGGVILPFKDDFPKDTQMYKVMTSKPGEAAI